MDEDYMCPNCVTPWKCNGPHEPDGGEPNVEAGAYLEDEPAVWAGLVEAIRRYAPMWGSLDEYLADGADVVVAGAFASFLADRHRVYLTTRPCDHEREGHSYLPIAEIARLRNIADAAQAVVDFWEDPTPEQEHERRAGYTDEVAREVGYLALALEAHR